VGVGRVRREVDRDDDAPLLHTVRGAGYVLTDRGPGAADGA
jgi:DNA-binding response OmpR family regulator